MSDTLRKRSEVLASEIAHEMATMEFELWQFRKELHSADTRDILRLEAASAPTEPGKLDITAKEMQDALNAFKPYFGTTQPDTGYYSDEAQETDIPGEPVVDSNFGMQYDDSGNLREPGEADEDGWVGRSYDDPTDFRTEPFYTDTNGQKYTEREFYLWHDEIIKSDIPDEIDPGQSWWDNLRERSDPDA